MKFFINFLKALGIFTGYGLGTYLVFELLKDYTSPYLIWILLGLLVICISALYASWVCHFKK